MKSANQLKSVFGQIPEIRRIHKRLHDLEDIFLIGIISVICGANSWNEMEDYARSKEEFLRTFLKLSNGIPSHDTFNRHKAIRSHWGIENKLHWTLDVSFSINASRKRNGNAAQNFSILNKIALNLLKNKRSSKVGVKSKRLKAGWEDHYLVKILNQLKV